MYYIIESEGFGERRMFRRYQNACMAALELALRSPSEVRVIRLATPNGLGRQILCVYNCKYEISASPLPIQEEEEASSTRRRGRKRMNKKPDGLE
jgi:hypothetical protein